MSREDTIKEKLPFRAIVVGHAGQGIGCMNWSILKDLDLVKRWDLMHKVRDKIRELEAQLDCS